MDWRTKIENKCQTTKIEPGPTTFCIQAQKIVFEFNYQTYSMDFLFLFFSFDKWYLCFRCKMVFKILVGVNQLI